MNRLTIISAALAAVFFVGARAPTANAQCLHSLEFVDMGLLGDVNLDGVVSVVDVQCSVLVALWTLAGQTSALPTCLSASLAQVDVECDGAITVADVLIIITTSLKAPLDVALDADSDGCPDTCSAPTVRRAVSAYADGLSTGGEYRLRPAPVMPAIVGTATNADFVLKTKPMDRLPNEETPP